MADNAAYRQGAATLRGITPPNAALPPILIVLAIAIILLPEETSFFLGGLRMTVSRMIMLAVFPWALFRLVQQISSGAYRFVWSDALAFLAGIWMVASVWATEGPERAMVGSGVSALEFVGAYIVPRAFLTGHGQALRLSHLFSMLIAGVAFLAPLDTLSGHHVIHDTLGALTGYEPPYQIDIRRGLLRAAGTMEHPILLGTACVIGMLFGTTLPPARRYFAFAGTAIGLVVAVSSAPICATIMGFGLLAYRRLTPGFEQRWIWLMAVIGVLLTLLFSLHPAPFGWLIGHTTFEPGSGYYRLLTWHYAGQLVLDSPVFGIGLGDQWARPDWMLPTVDSMWLRSAMSFGIPGSALIAGTLLGACSRRVDTVKANLSSDERSLGVILSIIQFLYIFIGFTTSFWGVTWIMMGVCAAMRAHLGALGSLPDPARSLAQGVQRRRLAPSLT